MRNYVPKIYVPGTRVLLLSEARKMPCATWSLPARESCPWAFNGAHTICEACYADNGNYVARPNVKLAQRARFAWVRECLKTEAGTALFVRTLAEAIERTRNEYFRPHDSGDLFSPAYVWAWVRIVQRTPEVKYWFPTRSWRPLAMRDVSIFTRMQWRYALMALAAEPNVTVRPSALFFNAPPPRIDGLAAGSGASDEAYNCPAPSQGNQCLDCRMCWECPETPILYHARWRTKTRWQRKVAVAA